jgi:hypothetical protein
MKYIISFRNGHTMRITVKDGLELVKRLSDSLANNPSARSSFYSELGIIICVSDITACHPEDMLMEKIK